MSCTGGGQRGASLIEMVMAIIIVSVALSAVRLTLNQGTARSADPVIQLQGQAVARAYLEEVLGQAYSDPDGSDAGESRPTFDDVSDYHNLAANGCTATSAACPVLGDCACDQWGQPIDDLPGYQVAVSVTATTLGAVAAQRVDVLVTHSSATTLRVDFSGYRTDY